MEGEKLRDWVENKLEEGVSEERLKKSLENTGHDPSIVEEVKNPFDAKTSGTQQETGSETGAQEQVPGNETGAPEGPDLSFSGGEDETQKDFEPGEESASGSMFSFSFSRRKFLLVLLVLLLVPAFYFGLPVLQDSLKGESNVDLGETGEDLGNSVEKTVDRAESAVSETDSSSGSDKAGECPDVGVWIDSVSSSGGSTTARVRVTRGTADVVLEVYDSGSLVASTGSRIGGEGPMTVDATGDKVVLHPEGCGRYQDFKRIG